MKILPRDRIPRCNECFLFLALYSSYLIFILRL